MVSGPFNSPNRGSFHRSLTLLYAIGRRVVLSLGGWSPQLHTEFHELRATLVHQHTDLTFTYRTITFYGRTFQNVQLVITVLMSVPATPESKLSGLGYIRFRSPLLTESRLISFPVVTEMFQFTTFASIAYEFSYE